MVFDCWSFCKVATVFSSLVALYCLRYLPHLPRLHAFEIYRKYIANYTIVVRKPSGLLITILRPRVQPSSPAELWGMAGGGGHAMNEPDNMDMTPQVSLHIINSSYLM